MIKSLEDIRILAKSDKSRREFCDEFLEKLASLIGADAGIVWDASSTDSFQAVSQFSQNDEPAKLNFSRAEHDQLLSRAASESTPIIVRPQQEKGQDSLPTLMFGSFNRDNKYLLELMIADSGSRADVKELMQQFGQALKAVQEHKGAVSAVESPSAEVRKFNEDELSGYLTAIHDSIDLKMTAANVANETRRLLDCDRVSVLIYHRSKFRVFAISGQPSVNRRSNTTRLLEKLGGRLLKAGEEFWYPDESEHPTQISKVLDDYLAISATRSLVVVPIRKQAEVATVDPEAIETRSKANPVIGGIIYEHCHQRWERNEVEPSIELTSSHSSCAIRNASSHHQLFLYPLWKLLGKSKLLTAPRLLSKTIMAVVALIAIVLFLTFWTVDFYVTAEGRLMPRKYKPVYSAHEGKVEQLLVSHGDEVKADQTLLIMTSNEHDFRTQDLKMEVELAQQRLTNLKDQRLSEQAEEALEEKIVTQELRLKGLQGQLKKLQMITQGLSVKSPMAGNVITWDLEHQLQSRVVGQGIELMEIADIGKGWILEIDLPIRREGHVSRAMQRNEGEPLLVTFLLAADTTRRFQGRVIEMEKGVSLTSNNEQVIRLKAIIEDDNISIDQVRSSVSAKIYCGRTSIGYQWLHDVSEAWNKYVWFLLF